MAEKRINRAYTIDDFERIRFRNFVWDSLWKDLFGDPELAGAWIAVGNSGNGKTSFALQLCKYLASKGVRTCYNSYEQGRSKSLQRQIIQTHFETKKNFIILNREPIAELNERLSRRKAPDFIVIDSLQYTDMKFSDYKRLKENNPSKLFLFLSHADGNNPSGSVAKKVYYDADVKLWIEGYRATCLSRLGGGNPYTIWKQGAAIYYNEDL